MVALPGHGSGMAVPLRISNAARDGHATLRTAVRDGCVIAKTEQPTPAHQATSVAASRPVLWLGNLR